MKTLSGDILEEKYKKLDISSELINYYFIILLLFD